MATPTHPQNYVQTRDNCPDFAPKLLTWFDAHGRHNLPWQKNRNAYRVWLSEIMLQQTQVATVIPYFARFTERFPTLNDLANAHVDDVLTLWAGLGYYTRARNLHKCAQTIATHHDSEFPQDVETLMSLPGIGRSTAGAIASQAFDLPTPILDGNVKRVLSRYYAIGGWPGSSQTEKQLWQAATDLTPIKRNADYTQAIMDLGATLCKRQQPLCVACPMQTTCAAFTQERVSELPHRKPKKALPEKQVWVLLHATESGSVQLHQRPNAGIWGGLWSLLEFADLHQLYQHLALNSLPTPESCMQGVGDNPHQLQPIQHAFSHYKLLIHPIIIVTPSQVRQVSEQGKCEWFAYHQADTIGLPSPIKKLLLDYWTSTQAT